VVRSTAVAALAGQLGACASDDVAAGRAGGDPPLRVLASFDVLADVVAVVGGSRVHVTTVVPAGGDPHAYEASARDVAALADADLLVTLGARLERFSEGGAWRRAADEAGVPTLTLADEIDDLIATDRVIDHGDHVHDLREGDPHVWLDPLRVRAVLPEIAAALAEVDPPGAAGHRARASAYADELASVHHELVDCFDEIPPDRRTLVVEHDAFAYFADRYGFEVLAVVLGATQASPSAGDVAHVVDAVRSSGVPVVFSDPHLGSPAVEAVARDAGIAVAELRTDSLAQAGSYVEMLRRNGATVAEHLGGRCGGG